MITSKETFGGVGIDCEIGCDIMVASCITFIQDFISS